MTRDGASKTFDDEASALLALEDWLAGRTRLATASHRTQVAGPWHLCEPPPAAPAHERTMASEDNLQQRLEKLGRTILQEVEEWEQTTRGSRRKAMEQFSRTVERKIEQALDKEKRKEERRERQRRQREEHRERQRQQASIPGGLFFLMMALVCLGFAVSRPELWWMVFVALGLGSAGARQLHLASERRRLERSPREEPAELVARTKPEAAAAPEQAASPHEVDVLCDQLLADLARSPEAVRGFLDEPEKTVESLRQTCRALDERRRQLVAESPPERLESLRAQRTELLRKHAATTDAETRRRLDDAVHSLEGQLSALQRLQQRAERVDGEYTSLFVLLQELRTRVSLARSAGTTTQIEGLRQSVHRLNTELDAITEALDTVQREGLPPIADIIGEDTGGRPGRDRERS